MRDDQGASVVTSSLRTSKLRSTNHEADAVANGITSGFAPAIRLHVKAEQLRWDMLLDYETWSRMLRGPGMRKVSQTGDRMRLKEPWSSREHDSRAHVFISTSLLSPRTQSQ